MLFSRAVISAVLGIIVIGSPVAFSQSASAASAESVAASSSDTPVTTDDVTWGG